MTDDTPEHEDGVSDAFVIDARPDGVETEHEENTDTATGESPSDGTAERRPTSEGPKPASGSENTEQKQGQEPPKQRGKREARRHIQQADGATESEKVKNAFATLQQKLQSLSEKQQQASQQRQQLENQRAQLQATIEHLVEIQDDDTDDRLILRDWAGGITTSVPEDELPDVISKLRRRCDEIGDECDSLDTRLEKLQRGRETVRFALAEVKQTKETLSSIASPSNGEMHSGLDLE